MVDYVDLVKDDAGIEDVEGGVVESTCEDDVFEKLQTVGMVYFFLDHDILYGDGLVKFGGYVEKLSVVGFVIWELGIIFGQVKLSFMCHAGITRHTFKHAHDTKENAIIENMLIQCMVMNHYYKTSAT